MAVLFSSTRLKKRDDERNIFCIFFTFFRKNNLNPKPQNLLFFFSQVFSVKTFSLGKRNAAITLLQRDQGRLSREREHTLYKSIYHHEHHWHDGSSVEKRGEYWRTSLFIRGRKDGNTIIKDEPREDFIFIILDEKRWIHLRVISRRVRFERFFVE